jgi:endonuclease/exonuclease/phosphatase (EEP) superfamily protein YafD
MPVAPQEQPPPAAAPPQPSRLGRAASAASVGLVLAAFGLTVAGRTLAAPPAPLAAAVLFLPYVYLAVAAAVFAAWTAAPDRRAPPVALAALLLTGGWLWLPAPTSPAPEPGAAQVRVVTWNLQRLWGRPDAGRCAAAVLESEHAEVVALLEVSARDLDQLPGLVCRHHTYTSAAGPDRGGIAVCTRGDRWSLTAADAAKFVDDEDWYYQLGEFSSGDHVFNVLAAHLYPYRGVARTLARGLADVDPAAVLAAQERSRAVSRGQSDQAAALLARVRGLRDATVVAGDLNSTPDAALHVALRRHLDDAWSSAGTGFGGTVTRFGLPLRVDYVYTTPGTVALAAKVVAAGCSDHDPVVVDLAVPARLSPARAGR